MQSVESVVMRIVTMLQSVTSIDAVVLGGSRASGFVSAQSDIDIGIYYGATMPINLDELNCVATQLDDEHRPNLVTAPGGWGPWVNAGAWLCVDGHHVDFILRETQRVAAVIDECISGHVQAHYQPGHPHAFINVMYMGELAVSQMLWDATGVITPLKRRALHYPDALQQAIFATFGFEARFSADLAKKSIIRNDPYYMVAHVIRSISALNQVVFAMNRQYCLNEKQAVARADALPIHPAHYRQRIEAVLSGIHTVPDSACDALQHLVDETEQLIASIK